MNLRTLSLAKARTMLSATLLLLAHSLARPVSSGPGHAPDGSGKTLYWSDAGTGKIHRTRSLAWPLTGRAPARVPAPVIETVVEGLDIPIDIAIDETAGEIYWVADGTNVIQKARLDGTGGITTLYSGLAEPRGLALDACARNLYWCDREEGRLYRGPMSGGNGTQEDLGVSGLVLPLSLELDRPDGMMYWTDVGASKVRRASFSGVLTQDVVTGVVEDLRGITLDRAAGKMYFVSFQHIRRADLDGQNMEELLSTDLGTNPNNIALDLAAGRLYWTAGAQIRRVNLNGPRVVETFLDGLVNASAIVLVP